VGKGARNRNRAKRRAEAARGLSDELIEKLSTLDRLDELLRGDVDTWCRLTHRTQTDDYELKVDAALSAANTTANLMKQLLAALRLPDERTGKRPQYRGARGVQVPATPGGRVSSLDRARRAKSG